MRFISIDFEYFGTSDRDITVICASLKDEESGTVGSFWLLDKTEKLAFKDFMNRNLGAIFLSYNAIAEGRALLSLGLNPLDYKWIDVMVEYKMAVNKNNHMAYGDQLIKGKEVKTTPPKLYDSFKTNDKVNNSRPEVNMVSACYKLLSKRIDGVRKEKMRGIILSQSLVKIRHYKEEITKYCESDVEYLYPMLNEMTRWFCFLTGVEDENLYLEDATCRARYSVACSYIEREGYPVLAEELKLLIDSSKTIIKHRCSKLNKMFPDILPFRYNKKTNRFSRQTKVIKKWCEDYEKKEGKKLFDRTEKEGISLSSPSFERVFPYRHDYPEDCFGAQYLGYLRFISTLSGIAPPINSRKKTILDDLGSDNRVRCYANPFGSASGRNQPPSTSFIPLKSAWSRYLIQPSKDKVLVSIDYASQEFYIAGLESEDKAMIRSYESGDPYLYTGKACGRIPKNATKKSHADLRDRFKSTTLGVQYGMSAPSLSRKISLDTGTPCSEDEAQDLIDMFYEVYYVYSDWLDLVMDDYFKYQFIRNRANWFMWGDNPNYRSVKNFKIQSGGASVLQKAVVCAVEKGLRIVYTLHDAIVMETDLGNFKRHTAQLVECMKKAFLYYYPRGTNLRMDGHAWGEIFSENMSVKVDDVPLDCFKFYVDSRGNKEYEENKKLLDVLREDTIL